MPLRYYQNEFLGSVAESYQNGQTLLLGVLPTGAGKAVITANVPRLIERKRGEKVFLFVHRDELVFQNAQQMHRWNPGLKVGIEKAEITADLDCDIVVCSIQTVGRFTGEGDSIQYSPRLTKFSRESIVAVLLDEAHRAFKSKIYFATLRYCQVLKGSPERDPSKLFLGVTATPDRSDQIGGEVLFDKIVYSKPLVEFIEEKWLCDLRAYRIQTRSDISKVKTSGDDFQITQLASALNNPERNELVVSKYKELGEGLPFLAFSVNVAHSNDLAAVFRAHGLKAYAVSGNTPKGEREKLLRLFKERAIDGLVSCEVYVEGVDVPMAAVAIMARSTKSSLWYRQALGRVMRPWPAPESADEHVGWVKPYAIILDYADVTSKHSLISVPTLFGLRADFNCSGGSVLGQMKRVAELQKKQPLLDLKAYKSIQEVESAIERIDLFAAPALAEDVGRYSRFAWLAGPNGSYRMQLGDGSMLEIKLTDTGAREVVISRNGLAVPHSQHNSLAQAFAAGDGLIPKRDAVNKGTDRKWRSDPPSVGQCRLLVSLDKQIRATYKNGDGFHAFATEQFKGGNEAFSKGGLSALIDKAGQSEEGKKRMEHVKPFVKQPWWARAGKWKRKAVSQ